MQINLNFNLKWLSLIFMIALGLGLGPIFVLFCRAVAFIGGIEFDGDGAAISVAFGVIIGVIGAVCGGVYWFEKNENK